MLRRALLLGSTVLALIIALPGVALAVAPGSLTQLPRPNDCFMQNLDSSECGQPDGTGLTGTADLAITPGGSNVYVVSPGDNAIAEFSRNSDGSLSQIGCIAPTNPIDQQPVTTCQSGGATGLYHPQAIAISPDGQNVYVAAQDSRGVGTIAEFSRNGDGTLTQLFPNDCIAENVQQTDKTSDCANQSGHGIFNPVALSVSPDGTSVYVADQSNSHGDRDLAEFTRNGDGSLNQQNGANDCIADASTQSGDCNSTATMGSPTSVVVSPDGASVYTGGFGPSEHGVIAEFSRQAGGTLSSLGCVQEQSSDQGCSTEAIGIEGLTGLTVSPDGHNLYSASQLFGGPIAEFARNGDGTLTQLAAPNDCIQEGSASACGSSGTGIASGFQIKVSPDGASAYATAPNCGSLCSDVAEFSRNADGSLHQLPSPDNCIQERNTAQVPECGTTTGRGLASNSTMGLVVSPDNANVYVAGPNDVAEFSRTPVQFKLTVTRAGTGNGSVTDDQGGISCPSNCSHPYDEGTTVTLTATPAAGSTFTGWSGGGCFGTGPCTVTVNSDTDVMATFDVVAQPAAGTSTLTVSKSGSGGGTVTDDKGGISCPPTCSHAYPTGTRVTLTANPANGSSFNGWSGGGCSGTGPCTVTMNSDTNVTATFTALPQGGGPGSPSIRSDKPVVHNSNSAGFSGVVNPEGSFTRVFWQYGLDKRYTKAGGRGPNYTNATPQQTVGSGTSAQPVSTTVNGLLPNALYHVRLVAYNSDGTAFGPDVTFITPAGPPPSSPALGKSFDLKPVSGIVYIVIGRRLIPLTAFTKVPAGSIIDALHGTVEIFTASGKKGKLYHGFFGGAVFRLTEAVFGADRGLTTLQLVEGTFKGAPSYKSCQSHGAGDRGATAHAALSSRILQTLHARATGRFRTRGRYAAGTVRGTRWTTSDRCDGTLLAVQLHSLVVRDFVKQFLLFLPQGHSYLAGPHSPPPPENQELTEPNHEGGEATGP